MPNELLTGTFDSIIESFHSHPIVFVYMLKNNERLETDIGV